MAPVERSDQIARLQASPRGRRLGHHLAQPWRNEGHALDRDQSGQNEDRENKIRHRPGGDHNGPLPERLEVEKLTDRGLSPLGDNLPTQVCKVLAIGEARARVRIACEADIAANGDATNPPLDAMLVGPAENRLAETEREAIHRHTTGPCRPKMAELVDTDHQGQNGEKGAN